MGLSKNIKKTLNSIYFRVIIVLLSVILFSSVISFMYINIIKIRDVRNIVDTQLTEKSEVLRNLIESEKYSAQEAIELLEQNSTVTVIYRTLAEVQNYTGAELNSDQVSMLNSGEVVIVGSTTRGLYGISIIGEEKNIFVMSLNNLNNQIRTLQSVSQTFLMMIISFGTFFMVVASAIVLIPIRKMSAALSSISRGDLDYRLSVKGKDDIAMLYVNFNKMADCVKSNDQLNKEFVACVSHEFRTPMTSIKGYAELIKSGKCGKNEVEEYSSIIIQESERLYNLSQSMLQISELDNKLIRLDDNFSFDELVRNAVVLLQNQWESKNIEMRLDLQDIQYKGNAELTYQVIINLISNAIKFSDNDSYVDISLTKKQQTMLVVADKGIGISESDIQKLYQPFFVANKSRGNSYGLGLSITKKILDKLGGTIECQSQLGQGTVFTVLFP